MTYVEQFETWLEKAQSHYPIVGDMSDFYSVIVEIDEEVFFQLGVSEVEGEFFCNHNLNGEVKYETSNSVKMLDFWLNMINSGRGFFE